MLITISQSPWGDLKTIQNNIFPMILKVWHWWGRMQWFLAFCLWSQKFSATYATFCWCVWFVTSGVLPTADMKQVLQCTDLADDAHQNLLQLSLAVRLFRDKCDTNLNCSRTAPWDHRLPLRADLEHWCLMLNLLSKKAHHHSIFSAIWPSSNDD